MDFISIFQSHSIDSWPKILNTNSVTCNNEKKSISIMEETPTTQKLLSVFCSEYRTLKWNRQSLRKEKPNLKSSRYPLLLYLKKPGYKFNDLDQKSFAINLAVGYKEESYALDGDTDTDEDLNISDSINSDELLIQS